MESKAFCRNAVSLVAAAQRKRPPRRSCRAFGVARGTSVLHDIQRALMRHDLVFRARRSAFSLSKLARNASSSFLRSVRLFSASWRALSFFVSSSSLVGGRFSSV
jgi:hypothetical protein